MDLRDGFGSGEGGQGSAGGRARTRSGALRLDGFPRLADDTGPAEPRREPATSKQREAEGQLALGLTPDAVHAEIPEQVVRMRDNAQIAQAKLGDLAHTPLPGADENELSPGEAWPIRAGREREAILQPSKPDVVPAARVMARYAAETSAGHAEAQLS